MPPTRVGEPIVRGNDLYAAFIRHCKDMAEEQASTSASAGLERTFRVFLNKDQPRRASGALRRGR